VNPGDRQGAAPVQCLQRGQHQITDGREQDRGIQGRRRRIGGTLSRRGAKLLRQLARGGSAGHHVHLGALGQRDLRGDVGAAAEAVQAQAATGR
jgi:hypothetical protein